MTDVGDPQPCEDAAAHDAASLEAIEQDLDNVDKALAALDSGDLDAAEALTAELDSPGPAAPDDDQRSDDQPEPADPAR